MSEGQRCGLALAGFSAERYVDARTRERALRNLARSIGRIPEPEMTAGDHDVTLRSRREHVDVDFPGLAGRQHDGVVPLSAPILSRLECFQRRGARPPA